MSKSIEGNFSLVGGKIVKEEVTRASETTKKEYQSDYSGSGVGTQFMRSTFQSQSDEFQIEDSYGKSSLVESTNVTKKKTRVRKDRQAKEQGNCCQNNCLVF